MTDSTIRAILFDYGGVLADEGFHDGLVALAREQGLDPAAMARAGADAVYDSGFVIGHGSAADFWTLMRLRTGLGGEDDQLTRRILDGFRLRPGMLELVRQLRTRGYLTGVFSDQTHWLDELDARQCFSAAFDHVFNSYHLGKGKRDGSLFGDIAVRLELPPGAILFIDDNPGNVERAREAGWHAILYVGRVQLQRALQDKLRD